MRLVLVSAVVGNTRCFHYYYYYHHNNHNHHLITSFHFSGTSPLQPVVNPTTQLQISDCSTFLMMCDIPGTAVFLVNLLTVVLVLYPDILTL
jgi:hypothetical protein